MRRFPILAVLLAVATPAFAQERAVAPLEVRPSPAFEAAVERGTRTTAGVPGPAYWQQRVDYDIEVTVEPATRLLTGSETITYHNGSPDSLRLALFNLYQNLFREGALRTRFVPLTGGITIDRMVVDGREVSVDDPGEVRMQGTLMAVRFAEPLAPGSTRTFEIDWHFTIPAGEGVPRMGMVDSTTGQIAQWYPQVAMYDDLTGWDQGQYLSDGEFYLNYGTFDVAVTAPAGTLVWGTGTLQNPEEVLPATVRERLAEAAGSDEVVHVVTEEEFGPGSATLGSEGESLTWRFRAENVRDAAFAFGDHYLWDATSGIVDGETGRRTMVHAFYRPEADTWFESALMTKDAIEVFSGNVFPYDYPHITSTEGLVGGMEYPMIVFVRNFDTEERTHRVIAHEVGHEWFPMMVGSDESSWAWMDEGVNTFITIFAAEHYYPESTERTEVREAYRQYTAGTNRSFDLMDPPDAVAAGGGSVGILGYRHPATALLALREILGPETFDRALAEYTERWLYKHPTPWDLFHTFEDVAGRDLDWFWEPWFTTPGVSDQAIEAVEAGDGGVTITVRNDGDVLSPIRARISTGGGATTSVEAPASVWFDGDRVVTIEAEVEGTVTKVELDPEGLFADVDPSDDTWTAGPEVESDRG